MRLSEVRKFLNELPEGVIEANPEVTIWDQSLEREHEIVKVEWDGDKDTSYLYLTLEIDSGD